MDLPKRIEKPWGHELWYALTDRYVGKILHVKQGHRLSLQYHERKDESAYLLTGRMRLTTGLRVDDLATAELVPGDIWRNEPGTIHTLEAVEDSDVLEVSTPEVDDVVRLKDDYGRSDP
jgi:mannose-6-phosphate isomerase